jgi:hypothetical protein
MTSSILLASRRWDFKSLMVCSDSLRVLETSLFLDLVASLIYRSSSLSNLFCFLDFISFWIILRISSSNLTSSSSYECLSSWFCIPINIIYGSSSIFSFDELLSSWVNNVLFFL